MSTTEQPPQPLDIKRLIFNNRTLNLLATYLLYDRMHPLEVSTALEGLLVERHKNFHNQDTDWRTCGNQICVNGKMILDNAVRQEVELNSFSIQLMEQYSVAFQPQMDPQSHQLRLIRAKLIERTKITPDGTAPESGRLIIP